MKNYIFYTTSGFTMDENSNNIENCQILGWESAENPQLAFQELKKTIVLENWDNISCQELKSEKVFYF